MNFFLRFSFSLIFWGVLYLVGLAWFLGLAFLVCSPAWDLQADAVARSRSGMAYLTAAYAAIWFLPRPERPGVIFRKQYPQLAEFLFWLDFLDFS